MRQAFISTETLLVDGEASLDAAERYAPWAEIIERVEGGYLAFESVADFETWRGQA